MPVNITQGNSAAFTVAFHDSNGNLTVPAGGQLILNYVNITTLASTTATVTLNIEGEFFTATWASSVAATGLVPWSVFAAGSTNKPAQSDVIRVIDP